MKKLAALAVLALSISFASAGDAPKQAPAPAKAECKGECKAVVVARPATLRERRSLVVLQPVTVQEVKKVEVKKVEVKEVKAECSTCAAAGRQRLLGRRVRTVADCACCN